MKNSFFGADTGERGSGDADTLNRFNGVLEPGERVLWSGQPQPFRLMRSKAAHALFGTMALVMLTMTPVREAIKAPVPSPAGIGDAPRQAIGLVVVCLACYSMFVPLSAYRRARRTWYAVTDRRVIRVRRGLLESSADFDEVETVSLRDIGDGMGDILLSPILTYGKNVSPRFLRGLFGVHDAEEVHRTINEARQERARGRDQVVHDYLEFLIQGKRADSLSKR